jgi:hypothetical protein
MSLGAGIYAFLSDELSVGERVFPVMLPQGTTLPAITYQTISVQTLNTHETAQDHPAHMGTSYRSTRVQFNCYGSTYDEAEALKDELLALTVGYRGMWGDVPIEAVLPDIALDDYEPGPDHWRWLQDLVIQHKGGVGVSS